MASTLAEASRWREAPGAASWRTSVLRPSCVQANKGVGVGPGGRGERCEGGGPHREWSRQRISNPLQRGLIFQGNRGRARPGCSRAHLEGQAVGPQVALQQEDGPLGVAQRLQKGGKGTRSARVAGRGPGNNEERSAPLWGAALRRASGAAAKLDPWCHTLEAKSSPTNCPASSAFFVLLLSCFPGLLLTSLGLRSEE